MDDHIAPQYKNINKRIAIIAIASIIALIAVILTFLSFSSAANTRDNGENINSTEINTDNVNDILMEEAKNENVSEPIYVSNFNLTSKDIQQIEDRGANEIFTFSLDPNIPDELRFTLGFAEQNQLEEAAEYFIDNGYDYSYMVIDKQNGNGIGCNIDEIIYGASTFKVAFVDYVVMNLLATDELGESYSNYICSLIEKIILYSDNDSYDKLRSEFGSADFVEWLENIGVVNTDIGYEYYPSYSVRDSAIIWNKILNDIKQDNYYSAWLSELLSQTEVSYLRQSDEIEKKYLSQYSFEDEIYKINTNPSSFFEETFLPFGEVFDSDEEGLYESYEDAYSSYDSSYSSEYGEFEEYEDSQYSDSSDYNDPTYDYDAEQDYQSSDGSQQQSPSNGNTSQSDPDYSEGNGNYGSNQSPDIPQVTPSIPDMGNSDSNTSANGVHVIQQSYNGDHTINNYGNYYLSGNLPISQAAYENGNRNGIISVNEDTTFNGNENISEYVEVEPADIETVVMNKAGWIYEEDYQAICDAGILEVTSNSGREYIISVFTSSPADVDGQYALAYLIYSILNSGIIAYQ